MNDETNIEPQHPDEIQTAAVNAMRKALGYAIANRVGVDPEELWSGPGATAALDDDTPPWPYWERVTNDIARDLPEALAAALPYLRAAPLRSKANT